MADWITKDDVKINLRRVDAAVHDDKDIDKAIVDACAEARAYLAGAFGGSVVKDWLTTTVPEDVKNKTAKIAAALIYDSFYDEPLMDSSDYKMAIRHLEGYAKGKFMATDSAGDNVSIAADAVTYHDNASGRVFQRGNSTTTEKLDRW